MNAENINPDSYFEKYCNISNISCTQSQILTDSCLVLQLSLPQSIETGVKLITDVVGAAPTGDAPTDVVGASPVGAPPTTSVINNLIVYNSATYIRDLTDDASSMNCTSNSKYLTRHIT